MKLFELRGQGGRLLKIAGECVVSVEALNHDDSVRCAMSLFKTETDFVCQRIDRPCTIDVRYRVERCNNSIDIYEFFGTEPLANYLYGCAGLHVPGLRIHTN